MNFVIDNYTYMGFFLTSWSYENSKILLYNFGVSEIDRLAIIDSVYLTTYNAQRNLIFLPRDVMNFI